MKAVKQTFILREAFPSHVKYGLKGSVRNHFAGIIFEPTQSIKSLTFALIFTFVLVGCSSNTSVGPLTRHNTSTQNTGASDYSNSEPSEHALNIENNIFAGQVAPLLSGMGEHGLYPSTGNKRARVFFNQAIAHTDLTI